MGEDFRKQTIILVGNGDVNIRWSQCEWGIN